MSASVNTGWRTVTPGECINCGFDDGWNCDGRGTIFCDCGTCPECHEFDGHAPGCPVLDDNNACAHQSRTTADGHGAFCIFCGETLA